ncbi:MAG: Gfo/Idh/MocA family oxidoreductase, partial [bacterium]
MSSSIMKAKKSSESLGRRQFLKRTFAAGGALAIPYYIPASALGRDGAVAPSERIVMGAIGIGGRGNGDLDTLLGQPDVQFVAVCDVLKAQRENAKNKVDGRSGNKDCAAYRDFRELLAERKDVDAVLIATGDRWHGPISIHAMQAGKDVYCEKPSCFTMAEGQAVVEAARTYGRVYQTGTQRLSEANHVYGFEMARTGRLGKLHTIYADISWKGGFRHEWLPAEAEPSKDELDWDLWLGPCPWRPYNRGYLASGWYNFYDLATDVAMWGAHTIAQGLAGVDMTKTRFVDIECDPASPDLAVRLAPDLKMVLIRSSKYWHGSCGERFDGSEGWLSAADGYSRPDASSPALLSDYKKVVGDY